LARPNTKFLNPRILEGSGRKEFVYTNSMVNEPYSFGPRISAAEVPNGRLFSMFGSFGVFDSSLLQLWMSMARNNNRENDPI